MAACWVCSSAEMLVASRAAPTAACSAVKTAELRAAHWAASKVALRVGWWEQQKADYLADCLAHNLAEPMAVHSADCLVVMLGAQKAARWVGCLVEHLER